MCGSSIVKLNKKGIFNVYKLYLGYDGGYLCIDNLKYKPFEDKPGKYKLSNNQKILDIEQEIIDRLASLDKYELIDLIINLVKNGKEDG